MGSSSHDDAFQSAFSRLQAIYAACETYAVVTPDTQVDTIWPAMTSEP